MQTFNHFSTRRPATFFQYSTQIFPISKEESADSLDWHAEGEEAHAP